LVLLAASLVAIVTAWGGKAARKAKPAQNTPASLGPNSIAFWDAEHGLVGSGITWEKTTGAISATSNGGKTFHVVRRTPGPVVWVSTAGSRDAWAVVERCLPRGCFGASQLLHSGDRGKSWKRLSDPGIYSVSFATTSRGVAVTDSGQLLATSDGGRSWSRSPRLCPGFESAPGGGIYLSLAAPQRAWAVCTGEGGAGNEPKTVYASTNGGKIWQVVANQRGAGRSQAGSGGLASYGYPQGISFTPQGYGLLWESRGNLYLTRDGGLHWQKLAVAEPEVDSGLSAVMLSRTQAFVLLSRGGGYRLLATKDGGQSWLVVQRWPAAH
jgi:photosystem II stability/assembly factor-like uncharacterized protein